MPTHYIPKTIQEDYINSQYLIGFTYIPESQCLIVECLDGSIMEFQDVPFEIVEQWQQSSHKDSYFEDEIKSKYQWISR